MNCPECRSNNLYKKGFRGGKQRYQCKDCGRYFIEGTTFVGRVKKLPVVDKQCPYCGNTKIIRDGMLESGAQRFKCSKCGKGFSSKTFMRPPVEYKCPYCNGKLIRSGKGKLGQPEYFCVNCHKSCSGTPPQKLIKFSDINDKITCPYCNTKNIKLGGKQNNERRYICNECGKSFTEKTADRLEKIKHEPRYTEICPRCGSGRIISAGIGKTGNVRFRCLECRRSYTKGATILDLSRKTKSAILMYRINLKLPIQEIAKHFGCSQYIVKKLEKEYKERLQNAKICKTVRR